MSANAKYGQATNVEIQCRASCSYCKNETIFWASTRFDEHGNLTVEDTTPDNWYRGKKYMSDIPDLRCDKCSSTPQY